MKASHTFEVEGSEQNFDIEVNITASKESYGDDADGRRGGYYLSADEPEYELPSELEGEERELVERQLLKQIERYGWDWQ